MSTKYIASNWRLPNEENSNKSDNYGLSFDGNELIDCGNDSSLNITSTITLSAWVKPTTAVTSQNYPMFVAKGLNSYMLFGNSATGGVRFRLSGSVLIDSDSTIPTNEWTHVVGTYDGSNLRIYLNGSLDKTVLHTGTIPVTTDNVQIGATNGGNKLTGNLSEVAIFDYALSSTQISTLYGSSSLGAGNPMAIKRQPVGYWPLGDNSASNPLTQPNEAVEDASVFEFTAPDHINLGNPEELQITGAISLSLWFNSTTATGGFITKSLNGAYFGNNAQKVFEVGLFSNTLYWIISDGTSSSTLSHSFSSYLDGNWHHLMVTWDETTNASSMKLFVDGSEVADNQATIQAIQNVANDVVISSKGTAYDYTGKISNVAIWNSDQSSEISNIYNSGVPATSYTNTPTAWYKLDQSANWEADSSGAWQIPDAVSAYPKSFDFDGSNDYIDAGNPTSLQITGALTISAWVKFTGNIAPIVSKYESGSAARPKSYGLDGDRTGSNNSPQFFIYNSGTAYVTPTSAKIVDDGDWHHLIGVFNPSTYLQLYIDGVLEQENTTSIPACIDNDAADFVIGAIKSLGNPVTFFDGQISNVQIWNTALSATEVETLYNNGVPLTTAIALDNLKAWYKLDNTATFSTNWSVPDASGNGNTGTSSGMTEQNLVNNNVSALNGESSGMTSANLVLSDLTRAVPYDSYSFNFDGSTTWVQNNDNIFNGFNDFSISMWINADSAPQLYDGILTYRVYSGNYQPSLLWTFNPSLVFSFASSTSSFSITASSLSRTSIVTGSWYHLTISGENGQALKLYINGVEDTAASTSGTVGTMSQTNSLIIGADIYQLNTPTRVFDGKISNLSIFNEALTSTEVLKLYANGVPQDLANFTPQPVAWYPLGSNSFWNGSQWTVRDMIGSNDGTGQNIGIDGLVGDSPRSSANGVGTNNSIPENLVGTTKWSELNSWSINMSSEARVQDTP